jgi:hypothetical protein
VTTIQRTPTYPADISRPFTRTATQHPALIPQEAAGNARLHPRIPATPGAESLLTGEIPAYPRSGRKRHDRPVTPEVAGSSPVAPVENTLQIDMFCCLHGRNRPPAFRPATGSSRTRIPDMVRSPKALQIAMFRCRARDQSLWSSRADPAGAGGKCPICRHSPSSRGKWRGANPARGLARELPLDDPTASPPVADISSALETGSIPSFAMNRVPRTRARRTRPGT